MPTPDQTPSLWDVPRQAKFYFSLGTVFASLVLPGLTFSVWAVARHEWPQIFGSKFWPWLIGLILTYIAAYGIPEPEGGFKLTKAEMAWGFANSFVLFLTVVGGECFLTGGH